MNILYGLEANRPRQDGNKCRDNSNENGGGRGSNKRQRPNQRGRGDGRGGRGQGQGQNQGQNRRRINNDDPCPLHPDVRPVHTWGMCRQNQYGSNFQPRRDRGEESRRGRGGRGHFGGRVGDGHDYGSPGRNVGGRGRGNPSSNGDHYHYQNEIDHRPSATNDGSGLQPGDVHHFDVIGQGHMQSSMENYYSPRAQFRDADG